MSPLKVVVNGALGKVGREVVKAISQDTETKLVGAVDIKADENNSSVEGLGSVKLSDKLDKVVDATKPDVIVDFTLAKAAMATVRIAASKGINMVIGTTGFSPDEIKEMGQLAIKNKIGIVLASNFALGAVLMMHMAKIAAKYFDYAEIIELHHQMKADAPSGTALSTARGMAKSRGKAFLVSSGPSRGNQLEGISIHSVRLPGLMAHQEVIFGTSGQTLTIRHDTINRECYMPGVMLAVKDVSKRKGLVQGLDVLLELS
jgi:4-hydroxy-tetrahydrodipicolinate reductase